MIIDNPDTDYDVINLRNIIDKNFVEFYHPWKVEIEFPGEKNVPENSNSDNY